MTSRSKKLTIGLVAAALAGALGFHLTSSPATVGTSAAYAEGRATGSAAGGRGTPSPVAAPSSTASVGEIPKGDDDDSPARPDPLAQPPRYFPRAPGEWQGMRVELSSQALCDAVDSCGLAMACKQGKCGPCVADDECAGGEACVLDHCVRKPLVACRQQSDCSGDALCALSGYSEGPRGNADLRAYCQPLTGGERGSEAPRAPELAVPAPPPPYETTELLGDVKTDARK